MSAPMQLTLEATSELDRRALAWLERNPHVYREVVRLAREWKAAGNRHGSIALIFERMRWEFGVRGDEDPDLNNSYRAVIAREVMKREPDLRGFFRTRVRRNGA